MKYNELGFAPKGFKDSLSIFFVIYICASLKVIVEIGIDPEATGFVF